MGSTREVILEVTHRQVLPEILLIVCHLDDHVAFECILRRAKGCDMSRLRSRTPKPVTERSMHSRKYAQESPT